MANSFRNIVDRSMEEHIRNYNKEETIDKFIESILEELKKCTTNPDKTSFIFEYTHSSSIGKLLCSYYALDFNVAKEATIKLNDLYPGHDINVNLYQSACDKDKIIITVCWKNNINKIYDPGASIFDLITYEYLKIEKNDRRRNTIHGNVVLLLNAASAEIVRDGYEGKSVTFMYTYPSLEQYLYFKHLTYQEKEIYNEYLEEFGVQINIKEFDEFTLVAKVEVEWD